MNKRIKNKLLSVSVPISCLVFLLGAVMWNMPLMLISGIWVTLFGLVNY